MKLDWLVYLKSTLVDVLTQARSLNKLVWHGWIGCGIGLDYGRARLNGNHTCDIGEPQFSEQCCTDKPHISIYEVLLQNVFIHAIVNAAYVTVDGVTLPYDIRPEFPMGQIVYRKFVD
ncbi:hypothetical protein CBL_04570 [Carabus blaptoides fortunei]